MMPVAANGMKGMGWRVPASILIGVGWLAFVIIWLFFYASDQTIYRNLTVLFVSVIVAIVLMAIIWVGFGLRMGRMYSPESMGQGDIRQIRWRAAASALISLLWAMFFLAWVFLYADSFNNYQNVAVVIVSLLVAGGLTAALWARWWRSGW